MSKKMMKQSSVAAAILVAVVQVWVLAPTSAARAAAPPAKKPVAAAAPCKADPNWVLHSSLPNFNADPNSLCGFYQYAWQSFLFLTTPARPGGPLAFESFPSVDDIFGTTAATTGKPFTFSDARTNRQRVFHLRLSKPVLRKLSTGQPIDEQTQAGSNGVLVDQKGNMTYYEELVDPNFEAPFIKACTFTIANCLNQPGAANLRMPPGSLELKVSWRPLWKTDANVRSFFTIPGFPVENAKGQTVTPDYMGLVGFHLVYNTPGHPEMVWATFEHIGNAPDGPCANGQSTCSKLPPGFKGWSYNNCAATTCANINNWPFPPSPMPSPPYPVTQAFRDYRSGTSPTLVDAAGNKGTANIATIAQLNQSVKGILPPGSPWRNYFLSGAVWTLGTLPAVDPFSYSNGQPNANMNEVGSTLLGNSSMETFTQYPNPVPSPFKFAFESCFTCHNIQAGQGAFNVSHVFIGASSTGTCSWTQTPPQACLQTQPAAKAGR